MITDLQPATETIMESTRPARAEVSKGRTWGDCLNAFSSSAPLVVSEPAAEEIGRHPFKGVDFREVKFTRTGLVPALPGNYYVMVPRGRPLTFLLRYFTGENEAGKMEFISEVLEHEARQAPGHARFVQRIPLKASWDGSDLLPYRENEPIGSRGTTLCSRRLLQTIFDNKWTNFAAVPVDDVQLFAAKPLNESKWPPESWYHRIQPTGDDWKESWNLAGRGKP
jgi:hypothetical protein